MKVPRYFFVALFGISIAVGLKGEKDASAQTRATSSDSAVRITVIGCVRRWRPMPADAIDTTVIPADETKYVLSNITLVPQDGRTAATGAGSTATLLAEAVTTYRLDDSADSLIAPHVGDRVQVTGSVVPTRPSPTGTGGRTPSPPIEARRAPMLRVESMQKISSDSAACSQ
jgi:hypothetical protein